MLLLLLRRRRALCEPPDYGLAVYPSRKRALYLCRLTTIASFCLPVLLLPRYLCLDAAESRQPLSSFPGLLFLLEFE
jgi:hypothetical protein